jgi:hypothetical protein
MTQEQLIDEIRRLPIERRVELLELISRTVREEMSPRGERGSLSEQLRGIAKFDGEPPTDEELREMRAEYLTEKYS